MVVPLGLLTGALAFPGMLTLAHSLTVVASVLLIAWHGRQYPYFPIEISRSAATNDLALRVFRYGSVSVLLSMYFEQRCSLPDLVAWVSMCGIAICDDVKYPNTHVAFIGTLVSACLFFLEQNFRGVLILAALVMMIARLVLSCSALLYYELLDSHGPTRACGCTNILIYPWQVIKHHRWLATLHKEIMYGRKIQLRHPAPVMLAFKIKGVMQWLGYVLIAIAILT